MSMKGQTMIRTFDYKNRMATIQGDSGSIWKVPLRIIKIGHNLVDMGMLLQERKANPIMTEDDLKAAISLIESWDNFEEKHIFLDVLKTALSKREEVNKVFFEDALREVYGIITGCTISKAISSGKLEAHKQVILHKCVVELVNFLLEEAPGCASCTFPSPKTSSAAVNNLRRMYKGLVPKASDLMRHMPSFEIFTGWRVASYIEKLEANRTMARWREVERPLTLGRFWN